MFRSILSRVVPQLTRGLQSVVEQSAGVPESNDSHVRIHSGGCSDKLVRDLQYEVREGREAGEVVVIPKAFIANRKIPFLL